jgi:hypothetical protein
MLATDRRCRNTHDMVILRLNLFFLLSLLISQANSQEWKPLLRHLGRGDFQAVEIDAPNGAVIRSNPSPEAEILRKLPRPFVLKARRYVEIGTERFYLTPDAEDLMIGNKPTYWVSVPGTRRGEFIASTTPATLVKRETRDFFKAGPETAEVYEETVNLAPVTEWGPAYRRAEIDFQLPAKVVSLEERAGDAWELTLTVYPAFESNVYRIPGPAPEFYNEPYRALITRPVQREVRVQGTENGKKLASLFVPGTVWAATFSEGRLQEIRIGWHDSQPPYEVSRLSAPHVRRRDPLSFRFQVNRLLETPVIMEVTPDLITGVDYTVYDDIAELGGPPGDFSDAESMDTRVHSIWNVTVASDQRIRVVTPLIEGRGAAGSLELESLGLGPSFEEELKALAELSKYTAPGLAAPDSPDWFSIRDQVLGPVPESQRGPEIEP